MSNVSGNLPKVVIVGSGFAGLSAARSMAKSDVDVTVIDRNIYSTFQPLLYQVATGGLNPGDVAYPIRSFTLKSNLHFRRGEVASIDRSGNSVTLHDGVELKYDYLILATGTSVNYFGIPGAAQHGFSLYQRHNAIHLRDEIMSALEDLAEGKRPSLTVNVVGGGPTGVEMAGTLAELRDAGLSAVFPEIQPTNVHVNLIEQGPELLAPFRKELRDYTARQLERRRVNLMMNTSITNVGANHVIVNGDRRIESDITIWAAGVSVTDWGFERGKGGRIIVGGDLRVTGTDNIFAVGDLAMQNGDPFPQLAQPAIQTGRHSGKQILRLLKGVPTQDFHYKDKGTMATIGRRSAVVQFPKRIRLTGTLAWFAWLGLHVVSLLGNRNRISTLLNLSWRYVAWPTGGGLIVGDLPEERTELPRTT